MRTRSAEDIQMITMKMLPNDDDDQHNNHHPQFSTRSETSSFQSSLSKRANSTRRSLKELSEGVQQRFQPSSHSSLQRINEDDSPNTPRAPPRPNRQVYRNSIDQLDFATTDEPKAQTSSQDPPELERQESSISETNSQRSNWSQRSVAKIEMALHRNYFTIAYAIVITAYLAGFAEYLYFRLTSLIAPEHLVFHPPCEGKANRKIGKDGFHYGISIFAFIGVAIFQLMCFFGLTISEKWTHSKQNPRENLQAAQREEFALFVRTMISKTMYRVFLCYAVCSMIICAIIFYMVAIQDSLGDTVSTIFLYLFDAVVIMYFIAFPLTTVIYHPYIQCLRKSGSEPARFTLPNPNGGLVDPRTQTSTLESNISGLDDAMAHAQAQAQAPIHQIPKLNFSRQDPMRQGCRQVVGDAPVLEEYLQSPRRPVVADKDDNNFRKSSNEGDERLTTLV